MSRFRKGKQEDSLFLTDYYTIIRFPFPTLHDRLWMKEWQTLYIVLYTFRSIDRLCKMEGSLASTIVCTLGNRRRDEQIIASLCTRLFSSRNRHYGRLKMSGSYVYRTILSLISKQFWSLGNSAVDKIGENENTETQRWRNQQAMSRKTRNNISCSCHGLRCVSRIVNYISFHSRYLDGGRGHLLIQFSHGTHVPWGTSIWHIEISLSFSFSYIL